MLDFKLSRSTKTKITKLVKANNDLARRVRIEVNDGSLIRNLAKAYYKLLMGNITSGKYPNKNSSESSYNPRYLEWKKENYGFTDPWHLGGDLTKHITTYKSGGVRRIGIPKGIYDKGGKSWFSRSGRGGKKVGPPKEITWYAYMIETGESKYLKGKARSVFTPTLSDFVDSDNIDILRKSSNTIFKKWEVRP